MKYFIFSLVIIILISFTPLHISAHEVYVLSPQEVSHDIQEPSVSPFTTINDNLGQFLLWAFGTLLIVGVLLFTSISKPLERLCDPYLARLKPYAPLVGRVTIGLSFIAAAYYGATYGPELPLTLFYGTYAPLIVAVLYAIGIMIILGIWVRAAALIALAMFLTAVYFRGVYMLTYINYLGEIMLLLIVGAGSFALQNSREKTKLSRAVYNKIEKYGFLISRVLFGTALIYASAYAKLIHSNLALDTVMRYHLTNYLPFEPHFLVLGAGLVEIMIGVFFIFGLQMRLAAIFLIFWLIQSLLFFGEVVWPHIILVGLPLCLFCYGYDQYSLEGYFFKKGDREPVL